MSKDNARVEHLERENDFLRRHVASLRENPGDVPFIACDNSCVCATPHGMQTNGGCRCDERKLRQAVQYWRRVAYFYLTTIRLMRDGDEVAQRGELLATLAGRAALKEK